MCAVVGIVRHEPSREIAQHVYTGLYHLNQRGQNSAGIAISRVDESIKMHIGLGTLDRTFFRMREQLKKQEWHGVCGIGHLRYATSGVDFSDPSSVEQAKEAIQPLRGNFRGYDVLMSYNGNLVPSCIDRLTLQLYGRESVNTTSRNAQVDSQLMMRSLETSNEPTFEKALLTAALEWDGAFSVVFLYRNVLYAIRDPWGFRPLELGSFGDGYIVSSESNIFDDTKLPGAQFLFSVEPGQCVILTSGEKVIRTSRYRQSMPKQCAFEDIYFRRQDSYAFTKERVAVFRRKLGHILAKEEPPPKNADFVVGVPDSGIHAARGYAEGAGLPYLQDALFRIHGAERSFIEPVSDLRQQGIELKLGAIPEYLKDKVVVVVDDSIVRGNVTPRVVYLLKYHGAREVHMRVSSPPTIGPCYYGIDTWRIVTELIARRHGGHVPSILDEINVITAQRYPQKERNYRLDSLAFLSLSGLKSAYASPHEMCLACWNGDYPVL